jgi:putative ABC transport system substrate-binding protein
MRRRDFVIGVASLTAAQPSHAQQIGMRRVGVLMSIAESDPEAKARAAAFEEGLQKLNWRPGGNIRIEYRWGAGDAERLRNYAQELAGAAPDAILACATNALVALRAATRSVPIVFVQIVDPVAEGYVASLTHPGGNLTGFMQYDYSVSQKWVQLLKDIAPSVTRVAAVYDAGNPASTRWLRAIEPAAQSFGMTLSATSVSGVADVEKGISDFASQPNGGMIVLPGPITTSHRDLIVSLAARYRVPAVYTFRAFVLSGGLVSYGVDNIDSYRQAASYIDAVLKGAKPSDLPVQAATKFELVVNLKTAKAMGLTVPSGLLNAANEVIE